MAHYKAGKEDANASFGTQSIDRQQALQYRFRINCFRLTILHDRELKSLCKGHRVATQLGRSLVVVKQDDRKHQPLASKEKGEGRYVDLNIMNIFVSQTTVPVSRLHLRQKEMQFVRRLHPGTSFVQISRHGTGVRVGNAFRRARCMN